LKITLLLGLIFIVSIQPLIMIRVILGVVLLYSLGIYYESIRFWFGYILMLIVLRGVLVIFTYVVSLIPNERFEFLSILVLFVSIFFFFIYKRFIILDNQSLLRVLLWEGLMSGYLIFLGVFLLGIIIIVIFLRRIVDGALRIF